MYNDNFITVPYFTLFAPVACLMVLRLPEQLPSPAWLEHDHVLYFMHLKPGMSWWFLLTVYGLKVCTDLGNKCLESL